MTNDVGILKVTEPDSFHTIQHVQRLQKTGPFGVRKIRLGQVARNNGLRVVAQTGDEHLHLLGRGVLRFVHDDKGIVESATAHEGQR